jgi:hypothetical protein
MSTESQNRLKKDICYWLWHSKHHVSIMHAKTEELWEAALSVYPHQNIQTDHKSQCDFDFELIEIK